MDADEDAAWDRLFVMLAAIDDTRRVFVRSEVPAAEEFDRLPITATWPEEQPARIDPNVIAELKSAAAKLLRH